VPPPISHVIFGNDIYFGPKAEGSVVVGATYERAGYDDRLTAEGVGWLLSSVPAVVPALAEATFRAAWVGLRPASPDNTPLLGRLAGWSNVAVATGHTAEGVLLSAITGHLMAQLIAGETPDLDLAPFDPLRFG
jgi:glycine oxidase